MKKLLIAPAFLFVLSFSATSLQAQEGSSYKSGIGLRAGGGYYDIIAASYKTFITTPGALELNLGFRPYASVYSSYSQFNLQPAHLPCELRARTLP